MAVVLKSDKCANLTDLHVGIHQQSAIAFQYLCDAAGEYGIRVASENDMCTEKFKQLNDMVNRDNFYLYFDSQNYELNHDYSETEILNDLYPYMCDQLHVKDGQHVLSSAILGTGTSGVTKFNEIGLDAARPYPACARGGCCEAANYLIRPCAYAKKWARFESVFFI